MREYPKPYEVYKHFKGDLYQIITLAKDSEDGRMQVVYQALYGDFSIYVRELGMFLSRTDQQKYPTAKQEYRFEKISNPVPERQEEWKEPLPEMAEETEAAEEMLDEGLVAFLEAKTYEERLRILTGVRSRITNDILSTMAIAMDIQLDDGPVEERYEELKQCLSTFNKFEGNRLR